ncbi:20435_t:CDS:2, partial [Gigaspora margarita]
VNDIVNNEKAFGMKCYRYENVIGVYVMVIKKKNIGTTDFCPLWIFGDISKAQILRSPNEKQVVVSLPQKPKKAVKLRLQQRSNSPLTVEPCVQENSSQGSNIHQQLITAQKAIFEGELFDQ